MNPETDEIIRTEEDGGTETEVTETEVLGGEEQNEPASAGRTPGKAASDSPEAAGAGRKDGAAAGARDTAEELWAALTRARERVTQLERERDLLSQGVPEEDLDYYVFKIGKLVSEEKDFATAAKEFLKQHRSAAPRNTGASLAGRTARPRSTNETMNRILRGN